MNERRGTPATPVASPKAPLPSAVASGVLREPRWHVQASLTPAPADERRGRESPGKYRGVCVSAAPVQSASTFRVPTMYQTLMWHLGL